MTKFFLMNTMENTIRVFNEEWPAIKAMHVADLFPEYPESGMTMDYTVLKDWQRIWDDDFRGCEIRSQWFDPQTGHHVTVYKKED